MLASQLLLKPLLSGSWLPGAVGSARALSWQTFQGESAGSHPTLCMIAMILTGAAFLTLAMGYLGLPRHLAEFIQGLGLSQFTLVIALAVFYIILGCFLDGISMVVLTMGVILPTVTGAGLDLIWFGIFITLVVEMAQITPPVGFNLFVLQGMTKRELTYIARVSLPMFFLMCAAVLLIYFVPGLVTWLYGQHETLGTTACAAAKRHDGVMNLRFVEAFYWVATLRSVSRAAEKLFITQSRHVGARCCAWRTNSVRYCLTGATRPSG